MFSMYFDFLSEKRSSHINPLYNTLINQDPDYSHVMYSVLPTQLHTVVTVASNYLGHGYYRLAESFNMPFNGIGFGFANSMFLIRNFTRLSDWDVMEKISYGYRLDMGESNSKYGNYWSTAYTWYASDVTFPGVILVVYFIGRLFAISWIDILRYKNPLAVVAFCCFLQLIYAFPMNNPLQDAPGLAAYIFIPIYWWRDRKKSTGYNSY